MTGMPPKVEISIEHDAPRLIDDPWAFRKWLEGLDSTADLFIAAHARACPLGVYANAQVGGTLYHDRQSGNERRLPDWAQAFILHFDEGVSDNRGPDAYRTPGYALACLDAAMADVERWYG
jgi:hypothetical protein